MKSSRIVPVIIVIILIGIYYLLTMNTAPVLSDPHTMTMAPGKYESLPYDQYKKLIPAKVDYIKKHSTFLEPYDERKFDILLKDLDKITGEQAVLRMTAMPNTQLGYYRVDPLKGDPVTYTSYQFEQGLIGWFWVYATFLQPDGSTASYMFYICRLDMLSPAQRKELNLPMASTTYYQVSIGVGKNDIWDYTPYKICRGRYTIESDSVFSFEGLELPEGWKCNFSTKHKGTLAIDAYWKNDSGKRDGFTMDIHGVQPPFFNGPEGCAPCTGGAGTMYLSYTQLIHNGTMTIRDSTENYKDGIGWNDRQWMNGQVSTPYVALLKNVTSLFKPTVSGLGKYLWLNLHLSDTLQYMVYSFFPLDQKISKGFHFTSVQKRYTAAGMEDKLSGDVEVLETTMRHDIEFPIKYKIVTKDGTWILDATRFDKSTSLDVSNNIHWDGSAIIYDTAGHIRGTGFLEANQFTEPELYTTNMLIGMGVDTTKANKELFAEVSSLPAKVLMPSAIALVAVAIVVLVLLAILARYVKTKKEPAKQNVAL
jgi:hypothetical protein